MSDLSIATYTASGAASVQYAVPFPFIDRSHVRVLTAYDKGTGVFATELAAGSGFLWINDSTIEIPALAAATVFSIVRQTPSDLPLVDWVAGGGALTAEELSTSTLQTLYLAQERFDQAAATSAQAAAAEGVADTAITDAAAAVVTAQQALTVAESAAEAAIDGVIPDGSISAAKLATGAVTETKLATGAVTETKLATGAVTETKLATNAVTAAKLAAGAVTAAKLATGNVTELKIANGAVTAVKTSAGVQASLGLADSAVQPAGLSAALIQSGPLAGFRNAIINGNFDVWQRETSFTGTNLFGHTADRWRVSSFGPGSGGVHTISRQDFATGDLSGAKHFLRWVCSSASSGFDEHRLTTSLEGWHQFANRQFTLGFRAKSNANRTIIPAFFFDSDGGVTGSGDRYGEQEINITTEWQDYTWTFTAPTLAGLTPTIPENAKLDLLFKLPANTTWTIEFSNIQLEPGPVATPFECRPIGVELALCQRYFEAGGRAVFQAEVVSGQNYAVTNYYKVTKRVTPSITLTAANQLRFLTAPGTLFDTNTHSFTEERVAQSTGNGRFASDFTADSEL